jgi:hypothetical protein
LLSYYDYEYFYFAVSPIFEEDANAICVSFFLEKTALQMNIPDFFTIVLVIHRQIGGSAADRRYFFPR